MTKSVRIVFTDDASAGQGERNLGGVERIEHRYEGVLFSYQKSYGDDSSPASIFVPNLALLFYETEDEA
jgi:hypothetical protein